MKKVLPLALGPVLVFGLFAGSTRSEDGTGLALRQPVAIERASYDYGSYYYQDEEPAEAPAPGAAPAPAADSPSDAPTAVAEEPAVATAGCSGCGTCCGDPCRRGCGCGCGCCGGGILGGGGGDPWTLPQPRLLQAMGIQVGGWLEQGITFNANNPADGFNGPLVTNDWNDEYQMNQLWVFLNRPTDTGGYGWDVGGRVDFVYGTDSRFGTNWGLETEINNISQSYMLAIPQMYVEAAVNNLTMKFGHFAGILDYEAVPAVANPFYSHSLCYSYTVPQLVTGMIGDYRVSERLSVQAGFTRGWMMFEDINHHLDVMAGVKVNSADRRTSLAYAISSGPQDPAGDQNRFVYSLVFQRQFTDNFQYVLVHNLGVEENALVNGDDAEWYGLNQYFLYRINPKWSAKLRFEWLRDDDGIRVVGLGAQLPGTRGWQGGGYAGDFYELTMGLSWKPTANILFRPECRWDWYGGPANGAGGLPFNDGNSDDQFTFGMDLIVTY